MDEDPNKVEINTKPNESENTETGSETKKKDIQEWIKVWKEKEQKKKGSTSEDTSSTESTSEETSSNESTSEET